MESEEKVESGWVLTKVESNVNEERRKRIEAAMRQCLIKAGQGQVEGVVTVMDGWMV